MIFDGITSDQVTVTHRLIKLLRKLKLSGLPIISTKKATNNMAAGPYPPYRIVYSGYIDNVDMVELESELYDLLFKDD